MKPDPIDILRKLATTASDEYLEGIDVTDRVLNSLQNRPIPTASREPGYLVIASVSFVVTGVATIVSWLSSREDGTFLALTQPFFPVLQ